MLQRNLDIVTNNKVGLICGGGKFPLMVAQGAKRAGHHVVAIGLRDFADPQLATLVDEYHWANIVRLGQWIRILRQAGCQRADLGVGADYRVAAEDDGVGVDGYVIFDRWVTLGVAEQLAFLVLGE